MRIIRPEENESLESAYNRLIAESRGQEACMTFNGKRILSSMSFDTACEIVFEYSSNEYRLREKQAKLIPRDDEVSVFDDSPKKVVKDIRIAMMIKDIDKETGLYHSEIALSFIVKMSKYAKYCKKEYQEEWIKTIIYYIYSVGKKNEKEEIDPSQIQENTYIKYEPEDPRKDIYKDETIIEMLELYEKTGHVMKMISENSPWLEVKRLVKSFALSDEDTNNLMMCMIYYSPRGEEFVQNVYGVDPKTLRLG